MLYLLCWAWFAAPGSEASAQARYSADEIKAAFLYNFPSFVTWPPEARIGDGLVVGMLNAESVEAELRRITAARPGRILSVRRIAGEDDAAGVHMLFVGARENYRLARVLQAVRQAPVLTVTDAPDGIEHGGIINFITTDRVQFEISIDAATRSGLHLNARLLSVALRIRKGASATDAAFALLLLPRSAMPRIATGPASGGELPAP